MDGQKEQVLTRSVRRHLHKIHESREMAALERHMMEIVDRMEMWLRMRDGVDVPLHEMYSRQEQLMLLKYRTWMLRYNLSIQEILDLTVPVLRQMARIRHIKTKKYRGMGLTVKTLIGDGAERILREEIDRTYPDGEHITIWRELERDRQLAREHEEKIGGLPEVAEKGLRLADCATPEAFVQRYERRLKRMRQEEMAAVDAKRRKRKYRWSPWN